MYHQIERPRPDTAEPEQPKWPPIPSRPVAYFGVIYVMWEVSLHWGFLVLVLVILFDGRRKKR